MVLCHFALIMPVTRCFNRDSQMTTSHYGALVIAVGILYSNAFVALAWVFYDIAYSPGANTQECPETHLDSPCTFGDTTEVAPWSVLFGSLLGMIVVSFQLLKWLAQWQDSFWLTFCSRFVGHMIGFRFRALVYKLVGTTVINQLIVCVQLLAMLHVNGLPEQSSGSL